MHKKPIKVVGFKMVFNPFYLYELETEEDIQFFNSATEEMCREIDLFAKLYSEISDRNDILESFRMRVKNWGLKYQSIGAYDTASQEEVLWLAKSRGEALIAEKF